MYCDIILANRNKEIEDFAKSLGYGKVLFIEDFKSIGLIESKDYVADRKLIENKKVKILVNPHLVDMKDSLHFRASGLNQVLCSLAFKNSVAIGFSLSSLTDARLLGRLKQNIKLCRKYKVRMLFFSFAKNKYEMRGIQDVLSLLRSVGMTGKEAKDALSC